jgi:hypothetical protein
MSTTGGHPGTPLPRRLGINPEAVVGLLGGR